MRDRFNREINYLRISVTDKCNLRCKYCMPENGIDQLCHDDVLTIEEYLEIGRVFKDLGITKIRITGGEPLVKKGIVDLVKGFRDMGIKEIAMTTNGILLGKMAKELKEAGLTRVNISLDTLKADRFKEITRGGEIAKVFDGIKACQQEGLTPIKLNTVIMRDFNFDEYKDFINLTKDKDISVRFIELMPLGEARKFKDQYVSNEELLSIDRSIVEIQAKDPSSPAHYYRLPDGEGSIGFINPVSCKFCGSCNRVRLDSKGRLLMCLHSNIRIELRDALRKGEDISKIIRNAIEEKPESHHLADGQYNESNMNTIGG